MDLQTFAKAAYLAVAAHLSATDTDYTGGNLNLATPHGELVVQILATVAQLERR